MRPDDPDAIWEIGLLNDDTAGDVREVFRGALRAGQDVPAASAEVFATFGGRMDDADDGPVIVLTLAALQWENGALSEELREAALAVAEEEASRRRVGMLDGAGLAERRRRLAEYARVLGG